MPDLPGVIPYTIKRSRGKTIAVFRQPRMFYCELLLSLCTHSKIGDRGQTMKVFPT